MKQNLQKKIDQLEKQVEYLKTQLLMADLTIDLMLEMVENAVKTNKQ